MAKDGETVDLETLDLAAESRTAFARQFPGILADGVLDGSKLAELLGVDLTQPSDGRERYGLQWAGKRAAVRSLLTQCRGSLTPDMAESTDFATAQNVFIEGDNLEVLKLLQKAYNDQVKLIYIDPPYNTTNDFVYNDDFTDGLRGYLEYTGQIDVEGNRTSASLEQYGRRHSKWLSMMYPRLVLARNLLTQDGVLLCSINDIELANLMGLLNEVFGEENFLATFIWNNDGNIEQQSRIKVNHEYIIAFARNESLVARPTVIDPNIAEGSKLFNDEIENSITKNGPANPESTVMLPKGFPASADYFDVAPREDAYPKILDKIAVRDGVLSKPARVRSGWSSRRLLDLYIDNHFVPIQDAEGKESRFAITPTGALYLYKKRSDSQGHVLTVLRNMGTTKASSSWLSKEWGVVFDYPKPERLIQHLVATFSSGNDVVLDFFAGSGTTMHAVALQNAVDGGARRSISVTLPEPVLPGSSAAKAGFGKVSSITLKRLRAVLESVDGADAFGLRVFRLGESPFLEFAPVDGELQLNVHTLAAECDPDLIAAEVLLKEGVRIDEPWEWTQLSDERGYVYRAGGVAVVAALDVTESDLDSAMLSEPQVRVLVVLEDALAGQDVLKANASIKARELGITMKTV